MSSLERQVVLAISAKVKDMYPAWPLAVQAMCGPDERKRGKKETWKKAGEIFDVATLHFAASIIDRLAYECPSYTELHLTRAGLRDRIDANGAEVRDEITMGGETIHDGGEAAVGEPSALCGLHSALAEVRERVDAEKAERVLNQPQEQPAQAQALQPVPALTEDVFKWHYAGEGGLQELQEAAIGASVQVRGDEGSGYLVGYHVASKICYVYRGNFPVTSLTAKKLEADGKTTPTHCSLVRVLGVGQRTAVPEQASPLQRPFSAGEKPNGPSGVGPSDSNMTRASNGVEYGVIRIVQNDVDGKWDMGATLDQRTQDGKPEVVVVAVAANSPAHMADLRVGDAVVAVNGSSFEAKPGMLEEVSRLVGSTQVLQVAAKRYPAA